jgi:hypothetical protein
MGITHDHCVSDAHLGIVDETSTFVKGSIENGAIFLVMLLANANHALKHKGRSEIEIIE